jgi:hypothetical protein
VALHQQEENVHRNGKRQIAKANDAPRGRQPNKELDLPPAEEPMRDAPPSFGGQGSVCVRTMGESHLFCVPLGFRLLTVRVRGCQSAVVSLSRDCQATSRLFDSFPFRPVNK